MSTASGLLASARDAYEAAVAGWRAEHARGGIVEMDLTDPKDKENWLAGQRWKTTTTAGARAMGHFQKAKSELDAASANVKLERGFVGCPTCPSEEIKAVIPARDPVVDPRLQPERDDEAVFP